MKNDRKLYIIFNIVTKCENVESKFQRSKNYL